MSDKEGRADTSLGGVLMSLRVNTYFLSIYAPSLSLQYLSNYSSSLLEGQMRTRTLQGSYFICLWQCPQSRRLRNSLVPYVLKVVFHPFILFFFEDLEMGQRFVEILLSAGMALWAVTRRAAFCSC